MSEPGVETHLRVEVWPGAQELACILGPVLFTGHLRSKPSSTLFFLSSRDAEEDAFPPGGAWLLTS